MAIVRRVAVSVFGLVGVTVAAPVYAASDATSSGSVANQAVASVAAPVASSQTAGLIGNAVGSAIGGSVGSATGGATGGINRLFNTRDAGRNGGDIRGLGLWGQGTYVNIHKTEAALGMDGDIINTMFGVDYKFTDRVLGGVAFGYENVDIKTKFNNGTYKDSGFTLAPYLGITLTRNWAADISGGYSWLNYDVSRTNGAVKGEFDGYRWFTSGNLTGNYSYDRWRFSPKIGILYLREYQNAYRETGTSTASNAAQIITFGQFSGGLKTGYAFDNFMPYVKLTGQWDFEKPGAVLKSNGLMSDVGDGGGVGALGVDFGGTGPWSGTVEGAYNSIGRKDLDVWQGSAKLRYQF